MKQLIKISGAFIFIILISGATIAQMNKMGTKISPMTSMNTTAAITLRLDMRKLWGEHVTWTRNVVCCIVDELPGKDQAVQRLLRNQDDIGNAIKTYYGNDAGIKLAGLLRDHITIAAEVVTAAKVDNSTELENANKRLHINADDISAFLSKANPNWKQEEMKTMMYDHLKALTEQVMARVKKDYTADVQAFDRGNEQILGMADMLSMGIVKQFPDKFKAEISTSSSQSSK